METEGSLGRDSSAAGTAAAGGKVTDRGADGSPFTSPVCLPAAGMKIIYERQRASAPLSPPDKSEGRSRVEGSAPRAAPRRARSTIRLVLKVREAPEDGRITKMRAVLCAPSLPGWRRHGQGAGVPPRSSWPPDEADPFSTRAAGHPNRMGASKGWGSTACKGWVGCSALCSASSL